MAQCGSAGITLVSSSRFKTRRPVTPSAPRPPIARPQKAIYHGIVHRDRTTVEADLRVPDVQPSFGAKKLVCLLTFSTYWSPPSARMNFNSQSEPIIWTRPAMDMYLFHGILRVEHFSRCRFFHSAAHAQRILLYLCGRLKIVARVGTHCTLPPNQVCVSPGRLSSYERNFSSKIVSFIRGFTFTLTSATFDSCAYSARLPWRIPLSLFLSKLLHASFSAFFMTSHEPLEQVVCQTCSTELDDCSRISLAPFPIP